MVAGTAYATQQGQKDHRGEDPDPAYVAHWNNVLPNRALLSEGAYTYGGGGSKPTPHRENVTFLMVN